jgi:WD40 repeat protein
VVSEKTVFIYDAATGELQLTLLHPAQIQTFPQTAVFYSPDNTHIMSLTWDGTAIIWDAQTGEHLLTLSHPDLIEAEWLSDGQVETRSSDGTRRVWPVDVEALLAVARAQTVVPLANEDLDRFYLPTQMPTATFMPTATITLQPTLTLSPTVDVLLITPTTGSRRGGQP